MSYRDPVYCNMNISAKRGNVQVNIARPFRLIFKLEVNRVHRSTNALNFVATSKMKFTSNVLRDGGVYWFDMEYFRFARAQSFADSLMANKFTA